MSSTKLFDGARLEKKFASDGGKGKTPNTAGAHRTH